MSLFDVPHPAHVADKPVLWFGVVMQTGRDGLSVAYALAANPTGRLTLYPLSDVTADVRHITERENIIMGQKGPGWVDLEDLVSAPEKAVERLESSFSTAVSAAVLTDKETTTADSGAPMLAEGTDYITDKEGNWFHPETGQELDKKTGKPIE